MPESGGLAIPVDVSFESMKECIHALDVTRVTALELHDRGVGEVITEYIDDSLQPVGGHCPLHE